MILMNAGWLFWVIVSYYAVWRLQGYVYVEPLLSAWTADMPELLTITSLFSIIPSSLKLIQVHMIGAQVGIVLKDADIGDWTSIVGDNL